MKYWLIKQEPETFSWDDFVRDGKAIWDGVRNYQARNNLQTMKKGDRVLFYHSAGPREAVGIAEVTREAFPDPTTDDDRWVAVELRPVKPLKKPVSLQTIKETPELSEIALIRQSRLSVMPLAAREFKAIVKLGLG